MKYFLLSGLALCLAGCGGGEGDSTVAPSASQSAEEFKKKASVVEDSEGVAFSQIDVSPGEETIISVAKNDQEQAIFTLSSSDEGEGDLAEKLVVSGKLTIK